jgi:hypothetical protein
VDHSFPPFFCYSPAFEVEIPQQPMTHIALRRSAMEAVNRPPYLLARFRDSRHSSSAAHGRRRRDEIAWFCERLQLGSIMRITARASRE